MNSTALIAEDENLIRQALMAELARAWPGLRVVASVGDGEQAVAQALTLRPQVCFLDIRMPGMSGLDVAEVLAEDWPDGVRFPLLVFVTAYDQHALEAFDRQAVDYLLKPVDAPRLARCVARLQGLLAREEPAVLAQAVQQLRGLLDDRERPTVPRLEVIQAGSGNLVHLVPVDEVIYFEAADKYVRVITADREHLIRVSLRDLLPQLDPQRFWQVHRGTVVQARRVQTAHREESGKVLLSLRGRPEKIAVSRLYAHLFRAH